MHYYDEIINGRLYHIEIARLGLERWRASVIRTPGVPEPIMPCYAASPDAASHELIERIAEGREPALTRADLDLLECPNGCTGHPIFLTAACHPNSPTWTAYDRATGSLIINCAKCWRIVIEIALDALPAAAKGVTP